VRFYALGASAVLTVIIGLGRIFLGVHWCTDVLGGWCIGLAWALAWRAVALLWERLSRQRLRTTEAPADEVLVTPQSIAPE
jgi:undecaprenyl-diphosphatase